ncbi:unnamed protein product [Xylocopa violacea]|uniref:Uncharacterized protein n=1 Tax=Xylocopa violacea TaxID=135666 RepID=A0ABP1N6J6_XYLVO
MMKYVAILFATFVLAQSQRPPYAGSNKPYPGVLPQFLDEQVASNAVSNSVSTTIASRVGEDNEGSSSGSTLLGSALLGSATSGSTTPVITVTTSTIPPNLPVDALGDVALVNKIKTWPRDKQPFWYINWQQIQEHRGDPNNRVQPVQTQPNTRSFFAG